MKKLYIDTRAHYDHYKFNNNRNNLLKELENDLLYIITLGTNVKTNLKTLNLIKQYDYLFGMIGFFPTSVNQLEESKQTVDEFIVQLNNQKIVGIGEIGLDYHWDCVREKGKDIKGTPARNLQKKWLEYQLNLAKDLDLPVSLHSRDAEIDTINLFNKYESIKGVMHCFSYGMKSADIYLNKGLYLGIGGTSTYHSNKELKEVIKNTPLDIILLETDAPYLSPQVVRFKTNISNHITYVIDNICDIKQVSRETVIEQTNKNAIDLFKFNIK